jgi:hypothetical protein
MNALAIMHEPIGNNHCPIRRFYSNLNAASLKDSIQMDAWTESDLSLILVGHVGEYLPPNRDKSFGVLLSVSEESATS